MQRSPAPIAARAALGFAVAIALAGCSGGGTSGRPARPFHSVKQMVAAMHSAGVTCASLHATNDAIASDAGQCDVGGIRVNLDIYRSVDDRDRAIRAARGLVSSGAALVGPNWTVGAVGGDAPAAMEKVRGALGGDIERL